MSFIYFTVGSNSLVYILQLPWHSKFGCSYRYDNCCYVTNEQSSVYILSEETNSYQSRPSLTVTKLYLLSTRHARQHREFNQDEHHVTTVIE